MELKVDTNAGENQLFTELQKLAPQTIRQRLDVGDVVVTIPSPTTTADACETVGSATTLVFERKSWADFVSSIRDNRYREQKARLLAQRDSGAEDGTGHHMIVFYMIECDTVPSYSGVTHGFDNSKAIAALLKTQMRDKIEIVWSKNSTDMAQVIYYISQNFLQGGFHTRENAVAASGYAGVAKHSKKRKNTEDNQFQMMLCTIPGVSAKKANIIVERYNTVNALVLQYLKLKTEKEKDKLFEEFKDGARRFGPALSLKLRQVFDASTSSAPPPFSNAPLPQPLSPLHEPALQN